jgi:hypothetical protein
MVKQERLKQINLLFVIQVWARDFDIRISDLNKSLTLFAAFKVIKVDYSVKTLE